MLKSLGPQDLEHFSMNRSQLEPSLNHSGLEPPPLSLFPQMPLWQPWAILASDLTKVPTLFLFISS